MSDSNDYEILRNKSLDHVEFGKILTDEGRKIFDVVNFVVICGLIGMFGIIANIINIVIFYKQGFTNTVNIALLGLAISDLCCLITLEWISTLMNPIFATFGVLWVIPDVMYLSGGCPHICFCRITSFITVYITAERYLCIALPLKVKNIITPKRTTLLICLIYVINIVTLVPEYATSYLGWRFIPEKNVTFVSLIIISSSRRNMEGLYYILHSLLSTTSFVGVLVFTFILIVKLKTCSEWRKVASSRSNQSGHISKRDKKTVRMVVLIAGVLIVCYSPGAAVSMTTFLVGSEFSIIGRYINLCVAAWSIACAFQTINSSVNIFLYYRMSSKYRQTFDDIFWKFIRTRNIRESP